jgi:3-deoxy-7-phosphoheptulonate synthase
MFIARMGRGDNGLVDLMETIKRAGHTGVWMCDPMHGNTITAADGRKTRYLSDMRHELIRFQECAQAADVVAGGVHLEATVDDVRECLADDCDFRDGRDAYTSLCDPRLTTRQAIDLLQSWYV